MKGEWQRKYLELEQAFIADKKQLEAELITCRATCARLQHFENDLREGYSAAEHCCGNIKQKLLEEKQAAEAQVATLTAALRRILAEPQGCRFCDAGKLRRLRTPNNPAEDHDEDCGFAMALTALRAINSE